MSNLQLVRGENCNPKQLKNIRRRLKQRERKNVRKLEQSEMKAQLEELKSKPKLKLSLQPLTLLGFSMVLAAVGMLTRNAWIQYDNDLDRYAAIAFGVIPELAVPFLARKAAMLLKERTLIKAFFAFSIAGCCYFVVLQNADQYLTGNATNTNMERSDKRVSKLEDQYNVTHLEEAWNNVQRNETEAKSNKDTFCKASDGTKCQRAIKTVQAAIAATSVAFEKYNDAKSKASEDAKADTASINRKSIDAVIYRKWLPLLGSILTMF